MTSAHTRKITLSVCFSLNFCRDRQQWRLGGPLFRKLDRRLCHNPRRRETAGKAATAAELAVDLERCIVADEDMLDDRESKPDATLFPGASTVDAEETLGQPRQVLRGYALAVVLDDQAGALRVGSPGDDNVAIGGRGAGPSLFSIPPPRPRR